MYICICICIYLCIWYNIYTSTHTQVLESISRQAPSPSVPERPRTPPDGFTHGAMVCVCECVCVCLHPFSVLILLCVLIHCYAGVWRRHTVHRRVGGGMASREGVVHVAWRPGVCRPGGHTAHFTTHFTCFPSSKVQILTPEELRDSGKRVSPVDLVCLCRVFFYCLFF